MNFLWNYFVICDLLDLLKCEFAIYPHVMTPFYMYLNYAAITYLIPVLHNITSFKWSQLKTD